MVGVLVIVVGVVLTAVGITLGSFKPLPGYPSPVPVWLGWSAAGLGCLVVLGGVVKSAQEAKAVIEGRRVQARALRRQRREAP
jgi:hypothetical protein